MLSQIPGWKNLTIKMEDDVPFEAEELPGGFTPLWLDVPKGTTHLEILTRLSQLEEIGNKSVTVLYYLGERDRAAADYCEAMNWSYRHWGQMYGCEDEVFITIDALWPESISRPHNLLVVVTTAGHKFYDDDTTKLNSAWRHRGEILLEKRKFPNVNQIDEDYNAEAPAPACEEEED